MAIFLGSRYENATVTNITDVLGNTNRVAFRGSSPLPANPLLTTTYNVVAGDRIDRIAQMFYGREDVWWIIADANPQISLADPLTPGTILGIPDARYIR